MVKGVGVESMQSKVRQFFVIGRGLASEKTPNPTLYRMRVFAKNSVLAKSKFWYHMKRQHKVRKIQGEIVSVSEVTNTSKVTVQQVFEKHPSVVKNYGIVLRYLSRTDPINMYKEYRDTTLAGAVSQMYMELSGRHRAPHESIQIIKTSIVQPKDCQRDHSRAFSKVSVKFPKVKPIKRAPSKSLKTTFKATRPIVSQNMSSTSLNVTNQSSVVICSRADEIKFLREQEERNRIERIKQVRNQEKVAGRLKMQQTQEKQKQEKQQQEEFQKYQEYLQKKQEIEELKKLRELEIERTGKAMRDAEEAEERRLRDELDKKEKAIRDERNKKVRGKLALEKEKQLQQEKIELEEQIKLIERKKLVHQQESMLAHDLASKFREQKSMRSKMIGDNQSLSQIEKVSKYSKKVENSIISKSQLDYTNTRFHNALILRHDHDNVIQEELEKCAYEKAKTEATKKNIEKAKKESIVRQNELKAKERGKQALEIEQSKKDKEEFEKEMKKIQVKEGYEKIQNGLKDKTNLNLAVNEKKQKQKQEKLQNLFEQEFLNIDEEGEENDDENQNILNAPPKPYKLNIRLQEDSKNQHQSSQSQSNSQTKQSQKDLNQNPNQPQQINLNFPQATYQSEQNIQSQPIIDGSKYQFYHEDPYSSQKKMINDDDSEDLGSNYVLNSRLQEDSAKKHQLQQQMMTQQQDQQQNPQIFSNQQLQEQASFYKQQLMQYQQQLTMAQNNYQSKTNPFFVPPPNENGPNPAPTQSAQPQFYNPYLEEIKKKEQKDESQRIQIKLNHPKQQKQANNPQAMVDEFLQENKQYLKKKNHDDSELPSDYDDEEASDAEFSQPKSSGHEHEHTSSELKSSSRNNENDYPMNEINKIINEAKQQNQYQKYIEENKHYMQQPLSASLKLSSAIQKNEDQESQNEDESYISDKYLNSNYDHSKTINDQQSLTTSYLADEFLQDSNNKSKSSQMMNSGFSSSNKTGKTSYLKNSGKSKNTQNLGYSESDAKYGHSSQQPTQSRGYDYTQSLKQPENQAVQSFGKVDQGQTPQSELSYSYSEMIGDYEGSNYLSSKMKMSNGGQTGSYLKSNGQTMGKSMHNNRNNYTIHEEEEEKNSSSQDLSYNQQQYNYNPVNTNSLNKNTAPQFTSNTPQFNSSNQINLNSQRQGGVKLEINNDDQVSLNVGAGSLAEAFRLKKQKLLEARLESRESQQESEDSKRQPPKKEKSKEELAEIRRQMMKQKPKTSNQQQQQQQKQEELNKNDKNIPTHLMSRLAKGEKAEISKKDMLKLTTKNYELLPEVKKKKEEEKKKEELKERMRQVKELEKQRRELMIRQKR
ncbi:ribosomal protein l18a [Stylonychia lemnae]|uniref:Ribosomal protein l18a n=1 Tax=Stylonychia lemnae TaxID=5949 RepID=A0A078AVH0_STYLE|nr:ribosomal protein l18a [Stylonychia lemnae]|eukprot:CDW85272.1 ribosomal protein l18a [Stylonychia lemnae]